MRKRCRERDHEFFERNRRNDVDRFQKMRDRPGSRVAESAPTRRPVMKMTRLIWSAAIAAAVALAFNAAALHGTAVQPPSAAVSVDADDLGGVVSGPNGPEAGVWVIAETRDLPTKFVKIVVTADR